MNNFLQQMKEKCEAKAKAMAFLEHSIWNEKHEQELKAHHGFTVKQIAERKLELEKSFAKCRH